MLSDPGRREGLVTIRRCGTWFPWRGDGRHSFLRLRLLGFSGVGRGFPGLLLLLRLIRLQARFVATTQFARPKELSPNPGHGHHWFGNAESYFLIGDALGREMITMLGEK